MRQVPRQPGPRPDPPHPDRQDHGEGGTVSLDTALFDLPPDAVVLAEVGPKLSPDARRTSSGSSPSCAQVGTRSASPRLHPDAPSADELPEEGGPVTQSQAVPLV